MHLQYVDSWYNGFALVSQELVTKAIVNESEEDNKLLEVMRKTTSSPRNETSVYLPILYKNIAYTLKQISTHFYTFS